jgi:hypothetical protein
MPTMVRRVKRKPLGYDEVPIDNPKAQSKGSEMGGSGSSHQRLHLLCDELQCSFRDAEPLNGRPKKPIQTI